MVKKVSLLQVSQWVFVFLLWVFPFVVIPLCFDFEVLPKLIFLRISTIILIFLWLLHSFEIKKVVIRRTFLDLPLITSSFILLLATFFGLNPRLSFYGLRFRYDGLITSLNYFVLYFLTVNLVKKREQIKKVFLGLIISASIVSIYAIVQRFGFEVFSGIFQDDLSRASASFGNPLFLGGYLALICPLSLTSLLLTKEKPSWKQILFSLTTLLTGAALTSSLARSAWIGVVFSLIFILSWAIRWHKLRWQQLISLALIFFLIVKIFALQSQKVSGPSLFARLNSIFKFDPTSADRLLIWEGAFSIIKNFPLLGTGPDGFSLVFAQHRPFIWSRTVSNPQALPDKAHNDFLQVASTSGIIELNFYLWILILFLLICFQELRKDRERSFHQLILIIAATSSIISGLIQLQFSFSIPSVAPFFWAIIGLGVSSVYLEKKGQIFQISLDRIDQRKKLSYSLIICLIAILLIYSGLKVIWADTFYQKAISFRLSNQYQKAIVYSHKAVRINPNESEYLKELSLDYAQAAAHQGNQLYFQQALSAIKRAKKLNRLDKMVYFSSGEIYRAWALYEPAYIDNAILNYKQALKLDPEFIDTWRGLARAREILGQKKEARKAWQEILRLNPTDEEAKEEIKRTTRSRE